MNKVGWAWPTFSGNQQANGGQCPPYLVFILALLLFTPPVFAAINAYEFQDPAQEQRFHNLIAELRCPKCQNQTIADSNAPLSQDLRQRVYEMIQAGRSDQEIIDFLVARYGDFITYRPPFRPVTWVLWFGPFAFVALAGLGLMFWVRRRGRQFPPELNEEERQRLAKLLAAGEEHK
jgi:cytochrome c-type biogenesis protein CcmH